MAIYEAAYEQYRSDLHEQLQQKDAELKLNTEAVQQYRLALFQQGDFTLHSGAKSGWKIESDALKDEDWETLAAMIAERQEFSEVIGVGDRPESGGVKLAKALERYQKGTTGPVLVVDDVLTTGESISSYLDSVYDPGDDELPVGWVVFARGDCPTGVQALFQMPTKRTQQAERVLRRLEDDMFMHEWKMGWNGTATTRAIARFHDALLADDPEENTQKKGQL